MPRRIRYFPPGSMVEVTCRTLQGRLFLTPTPLVRELTLGVLARAARLYPVEVHAFVFLSNHYHLLLSVPSAQQLARFMNYLNSNLAREVGRAVRWRDRFWSRRYQAILITEEVGAQVGRLRYLLSHGCKEMLVQRPEDWPGPHSGRALAEGLPVSGRWVNRTGLYRSRSRRRTLRPGDFEIRETLTLAPLPVWRHLPEQEVRNLVRGMLREIEQETRRAAAFSGKCPLGPRRILAQAPRRPITQVDRKPGPLIHAVGHQLRDQTRSAYRCFVLAFRQASLRLRQGDRLAVFPEGCFPPGLPFVQVFEPG